MISNQKMSCKIKQFVAVIGAAAIGSAAAWGAQGEQTPSSPLPVHIVPGYGPGIAGHVLEGPITPTCRPNVPCVRPFANATILIIDKATNNTVGEAVTNVSGSFLVSVPPGTYTVHVEVVDFPRCPEVQATVGQFDFAPVQSSCNTGVV